MPKSEMFIKLHIQAEKKFCGYCHFLHSREGYLHPDPDEERYWCDAFAQEVQADKKSRPVRIDDCLKAGAKNNIPERGE